MNVSIGTALIARYGSGSLHEPFSQLPAEQGYVILAVDNNTVYEFDYRVSLANIPKLV